MAAAMYSVHSLEPRSLRTRSSAGDRNTPAHPCIAAERSRGLGHRYADFNPDVDEVAACGIGALVAGKVAAKAGLFKGLIAVLLASKKLLILGLIGLGLCLVALFSRRKAAQAAAHS
jgi:uncharacterized membrane-anchored protein